MKWTKEHADRLEELEASISDEVADGVDKTITVEQEDSNCLVAAQAEIKRLTQWVSDLQSGVYVNCVYCGHRYGPGETTPVSMADALKAHIEACPEHPMSRLKAENEALRACVDYANGAVEDVGSDAVDFKWSHLKRKAGL